MDALHRAHEITAWFLIVSNAIVGFWALGAQYLPALRHRVLWYATAVAQISTIVVAVIGALIVNDGVELEAFHALYGFSTIFAVAILYSYRTSPFIADKVHLLYGCGGLFIAGLGIRALFLDGGTPADDTDVIGAIDASIHVLAAALDLVVGRSIS